MHVIKMNNDKTLMTTIKANIYRFEHKSDTLVFMLPQKYEDLDIADCNVYARFLLPDEEFDPTKREVVVEEYPDEHGGTVVEIKIIGGEDGRGHSVALERDEEPYKSYYRYHMPITNLMTQIEGDVEVWLYIIKHDVDARNTRVLKTGSIFITILPYKDITEYLPQEDIDQLDELEQRVWNMEQTQVDNIAYHEEDKTIRLVAKDNDIGDPLNAMYVYSDVSKDDVYEYDDEPVNESPYSTTPDSIDTGDDDDNDDDNNSGG